MHTEQDENYQSGYEWWLMAEAKKVNYNYYNKFLSIINIS